MSTLQGLRRWLRQQGDGEIIAESGIGGGCINHSSLIRTHSGRQLFVKQHPAAPAGMFDCEARSLQLMADSKTLRVPQPCYCDRHCLAMEYLPSGRRRADYWEDFGRSLAAMHRHTAPQFGLDFDTYCGTTLQPNSLCSDGVEFFIERRLMMQGRLAVKAGHWSTGDLQRLEKFCNRLRQLVPEQPASLLHGDLWSGNAHVGPEGEPVLIDPALYYGWREAELAMTALFGGFAEAFYRAYDETWPLTPGWRERLPVYNLYHVLNHLNLFGGGYRQQAERILAHWN